MSEPELVTWRLERIETKLDEALREHGSRIDSLESFRDRQQARAPIWRAGALAILGLALKELWGLIVGGRG